MAEQFSTVRQLAKRWHF